MNVSYTGTVNVAPDVTVKVGVVPGATFNKSADVTEPNTALPSTRSTPVDVLIVWTCEDVNASVTRNVRPSDDDTV
ncbi:hypothetical protein FM119_02520 [Mycetocola reblochoni REB411]|uniref:Uncharacterized protein n=1 Tax=Mycetocola reblochoni REB411 TaxID=1255698 RepID=A0A1R4IM86_9MICO|nr:hypothetical protein FM119_02520 [Mycetocola reblochoni REB411]